jgi:hypothetical protein
MKGPGQKPCTDQLAALLIIKTYGTLYVMAEM